MPIQTYSLKPSTLFMQDLLENLLTLAVESIQGLEGAYLNVLWIPLGNSIGRLNAPGRITKRPDALPYRASLLSKAPPSRETIATAPAWTPTFHFDGHSWGWNESTPRDSERSPPLRFYILR